MGKLITVPLVRDVGFEHRRNQVQGNKPYCAVCGREVSKSNAVEVELVGGGSLVALRGTIDTTSPDYCGVHLIGRWCYSAMMRGASEGY